MTIVTFKLKNLDPFYKNSDFYNNSISFYDEDEDISIDKRYWIEDFSFLSNEDINLDNLRNAANVYRYWGTNDIHASFYHALTTYFNNKNPCETFFEEYKDFSDIYKFKEVLNYQYQSPIDKLKGCIKTGSLPILKQYYIFHRTLEIHCSYDYYGFWKDALEYIAEIGNIDCLKFAYETNTVKWTSPYLPLYQITNK